MAKKKPGKPARPRVVPAQAGKAEAAGPAGDEKEKGRRAWLNLPVTVALIGLLGAIGGVFINHLLDSPQGATAGSPQLELDSLASQPGKVSQPPALDFELRNTGTQLAIITGVRITVLHTVSLAHCASQGYLPVSGRYHATLPPDAKPGSSVVVPVNQRIGPNEADRFKVSLRSGPEKPGTIWLYDTRVELLYDRTKTPVRGGNVVMAVPFFPPNDPNSEYYWTQKDREDIEVRSYQSDLGRFISLYANYVPKLSRCLLANSEAIRTFTHASADPSPQLASIMKQLSYCCVAKPPPLQVISCGRALQGPSSFTVGCDDEGDGIQFTGMTWSAWGWSQKQYHGEAIGTGTVRLLDCPRPGGVGHLANYPATVTLSDPRSSRFGWVWNAVKVSYTTKHPAGTRDFSYSDLRTPISQTCDIQ
jgi:hypothetical protein